jgi:carbamoyltransferase
MLLVAPVAESRRLVLNAVEDDLFGIEKLKVLRSQIPSVTHVDYSARVQTVSADVNERYYALISRFHDKFGVPLLINTSFNVRGEPPVCSPEDAFRCFMRTDMDYLVLDRFIIDKTKQTRTQEDTDWMNEYELD